MWPGSGFRLRQRPVDGHAGNPQIAGDPRLRDALSREPADLAVVDGFPPPPVDAPLLRGLYAGALAVIYLVWRRRRGTGPL